MPGKRRGHGEGSIYRRKDGSWAGAVDLGVEGSTRKRRVVYGKTQTEVRTRLRELQAATEAGIIPGPATLTVEQFLTRWLSDLLPGTVSPRTEVIYANIVRLYLVPLIGSIRLTRLTPSDVSKVLATMTARGYTPETRRLARAVLRRALRRAEQEGLITRNVAAIADRPRIPRREGRTLTPEQARQFLAVVQGDRLEGAGTGAPSSASSGSPGSGRTRPT